MEFEEEDEVEEGETAGEDAAEVVCPYCGESQEIALDPGGGPDQEFVQDCEICCRPWNVHVAFRRDGSARVSVEAADEAGGDVGEDED